MQPSISQVRVEVVPNPERAGQLSRPRAWEALETRIDEIGDSVAEIANRLRARLNETLDDTRETGWTINEVALTFSLDLEAEAGIVVARAKTTAGFEVSVTWSRQ